MKKWKYVSGISSACIGLYMIFRLFLAELGNIMSIDNFKIPLFNVIFVSIVSVTAGCVSIIYAESENKKGNIISLCMNVIATYVLFFLRKSELDLLIFGIWFLICILRSPADSDAFRSGRYAEHNGHPKTIDFIV